MNNMYTHIGLNTIVLPICELWKPGNKTTRTTAAH